MSDKIKADRAKTRAAAAAKQIPERINEMRYQKMIDKLADAESRARDLFDAAERSRLEAEEARKERDDAIEAGAKRIAALEASLRDALEEFAMQHLVEDRLLADLAAMTAERDHLRFHHEAIVAQATSDVGTTVNLLSIESRAALTTDTNDINPNQPDKGNNDA